MSILSRSFDGLMMMQEMLEDIVMAVPLNGWMCDGWLPPIPPSSLNYVTSLMGVVGRR
jgi:hypothetical protein